MPKHSAGLLLYREQRENVEVFLVHPGGPFWAKKDLGVWSIPKGEFDDEEPLLAAKREFKEETSFDAPQGEYVPLKQITQKSGKIVHAWAIAGEVDAEHIHSNEFEIQWPPKFGKVRSFPEIDRGAWFPVDVALQKINPAQARLIQELLEKLKQ